MATRIIKKFKFQLAVMYDCLAAIAAWTLSYCLIFNLSFFADKWFSHLAVSLPFILAVQFIANISFGLYRGIWRFASVPDLYRIIKSILVSTAIIVMAGFFLREFIVFPRSVPLIYCALLILFTGGARLITRSFRDHHSSSKHGKRTLIIGAGSAGEGLVRDLQRTPSCQYTPVAFVDDNPAKVGQEIRGIRVKGKINSVRRIITQMQIELIMIAIPSADSSSMRRIVQLCEKTGVAFQTLPKLIDIANGRVDINSLRNVSVEDLLGRDVVKTDQSAISEQLYNKVVLVTGGGGSIGSELCNQIASETPKLLVIVDHSEFNLYSIGKKLQKLYPSLPLALCLNDITDKISIDRCFATHQPEVVFHAGAYKHVPLLENQAVVAAKNNVLGTYVLATAAVEHKVKNFILISTDKAVRPSNVMGTTKRVAEMVCHSLNDTSSTNFITVRFGNVLGSAGSVVPLFKQQVEEGGPVTVTHPDITRYFMTIPEACQLILQAAILGEGGEIFVLDMGEPVKISYLAEQVIRLAGLVPNEDINIEYIGLRPGDKLYEELFHEGEQLQQTSHHKIFTAQARKIYWDKLSVLIGGMRGMIVALAEGRVLQLLQELVPEAKIEIETHQNETAKSNDDKIEVVV